MTLAQWLVYLESLHPEEIELGLDRIRQVAEHLPLDFSKQKVICVGGTNGKGSTVRLLLSVLLAAGNKVGAYTSPHLLQYNERVCINNEAVDDEALCIAFSQVESARGSVQLTYFEFGTLAALVLFSQQPLDYILLEVGLGGRLDAVNILDANLSILTNVALDHVDWLGDNREDIGHEKAGIFKAERPALYGEQDIPNSVLMAADVINANLFRHGQDFQWAYDEGSEQNKNDSWHWQGKDETGAVRHLNELPSKGFPLNYSLDNVALVLQAVTLLDPSIQQETLVKGIREASLPGRFQIVPREASTLILDVAHNSHAAKQLLSNLQSTYGSRKIKIVVAMLADKDIANFLNILKPIAEKWYVAEIKEDRGSPAKILYNHLQEMDETSIACFDNINAAFKAAESEADVGDVILVTGSFYTVSTVLESI